MTTYECTRCPGRRHRVDSKIGREHSATRLVDGILSIPSEDYHADPCERPSLSASIAHLICSKSPRHAFIAHPRLNPELERKSDTKFDIGTVAHALLLEERDPVDVVEIIDAFDWKTKLAREQRDEARAAGRVPLLAGDFESVAAMLLALRSQLDALNLWPAPFTDGLPEQTLIWEEQGIFCRARIDWLRDDLTVVDDYKTAHNAHPERWQRGAMFDNGYDIQAALYLRGIYRLTGERSKWRWIVQEKAPPYVLTVFEPGADVLAVAEAKVEYAIKRWRECLLSGEWPGYALGPIVAELPAWADDARWLVDEYRQEAA